MLVKSKVKYIQSLSHKKQRDALGLFVAEGPKIINELLASGIQLVDLFAVTAHVVRINIDASHITVVDDFEMEKISSLTTPPGALGVFRKPALPVLQLADTITVLLDDIQDPGNLGTIIRTADWFGIAQVVCSAGCADAFNSKTVQSTMGSIGRVKVYSAELRSVLEGNRNIFAYAAALEGEDLFTVKPPQACMLVIGNESKGVSKDLLSVVSQCVTIPGKGTAESLNAAVAAGIILAHFAQ